MGEGEVNRGRASGDEGETRAQSVGRRRGRDRVRGGEEAVKLGENGHEEREVRQVGERQREGS